MKKKTMAALALGALMMSQTVFADAQVVDEIVSLGADLSPAQKQMMLQNFGAHEGAQILEVTNREEHEALDGIVPVAQVGRKALSSVMMVTKEPGSGLKVIVEPTITYIGEATYRDALITAGVTDATIHVGAPMKVSGTAALTGIFKAYETSSGKKIPKDLKRIANEELVITEEIFKKEEGTKASDIMNTIKAEVAEKNLKDPEEVKVLIQNITNHYEVRLTDAQVERLADLFVRMQETEVDWDQVRAQTEKYSERVKNYLNSDEGKEMVENSKSFIRAFLDWLKSFFE